MGKAGKGGKARHERLPNDGSYSSQMIDKVEETRINIMWHESVGKIQVLKIHCFS